MQKRKYSDIGKEVRSVLLTYPSSVTLDEFLKSYRGLVGERLPSKTLGYSSDIEFLESMPDVVNVCCNSSGKISLTGIADETSEHIQRLVSRQRKCPPKRSNKNFSNPRMSNSFHSVKQQPVLPGPLRAEILNLMNIYHMGIAFSSFVIAYRKKYNKCLPLPKGLDSLEELINLIPELEIKTLCNERHIYFVNNRINGTILQSQQAKGKECNKVLQPVTTIHSSGISDDVLQIFQAMLQRFPNGIKDVNFPSAYKIMTRKQFELSELGYNSLNTLVDALPHIFKRVKDPKGGQNWIIYPAGADVEHSSEAENSTSSSSQVQTSSLKVRTEIPADVASPSLQYIQSKILENLDLNDYIPLYISAIINPCIFWFRVQTPDAIREFEKFENNLGYFYENCDDDKYRMRDIDIKIGVTCVIYNPEDGLWYRSLIKAIPTIKLVHVLFVDYGSYENIPRSHFYYVKSKFHDYPAYAFKSKLDYLKPSNNATTWSTKAIRRFTELCNCLSIMAHIKPVVDGDTFPVYLCNTSGEMDIHLHDALIQEGLAEMCFQSDVVDKEMCLEIQPKVVDEEIYSDIHSDDVDEEMCLEIQSDVVDDSNLPNDCKKPVSNGITNESECSLESPKQNEYISQSDETSSLSESEELHVEKKIAFSTKLQIDDGAESNLSQDLKGQVSKRYVKLVQLCEDYKIHILNVRNNLFTTSGDIAKLIWSEEGTQALTDRLRCKNLPVPSVKISRENYASLFEQCIRYKIPEYEKLESSDSSLILYSLYSAFNILNIFGHPSVCLRLAIQNEIRSFNPLDPIWKEFNYDEIHDLSDIEKEIEEQLSKLCLDDLKAKSNLLKLRRILLLQRGKNASATQDLERIDNLQNAIARRMKQIESICLQFPICVPESCNGVTQCD